MDDHYASLDRFIKDSEDSHGVRFSWNLIPSSRSDASKTVIPIGALYTPLSKTKAVIRLPYEPIRCSSYQCEAMMNSFCQVDYQAHVWICCFCQARNMMPPNYHKMTSDQRSAELVLPSVEYILKTPERPTVFLFVVDTCLDEVEMSSLRDNLQMTLGLIPQQAYVGLISFGRVVYLHDLVSEGVSRTFVFNGAKNYSKEQLQGFLGMQKLEVTRTGHSVPANRFVLPLESVDANVGDLIGTLSPDSWSVESGKHPLRATGAALSVAVGLLEMLCANAGGRIMVFTGGPCTTGPGQVCENDMKTPIRTHHDIFSDNCSFLSKSAKFYSALADRACDNGQVVDLFSCTPKETGIYEMSACPSLTGGEIIFADSFESELFSRNLRALFQHDADGDLQIGLNAAIKLKVSRDLSINGCIGHCKSHNKRDSTVSSNPIGSGGTNLWKVCGLTPRTTLAFYFESENKRPSGPQGQAFFQFATNYQHSAGKRILRVTTVVRNWAGPSEGHLISHYFDQFAGTVLMARKGIQTAANDISFKVGNYFDKTLINTCAQFGEFQTGNAHSYRFHPRFTMIPQFVFHLRRSQFSRTSNNSPDETAYNRHVLMTENVRNSLLMIQPMLRSYSFEQRDGSLEFVVKNAALDASSIRDDCVLLMDTFFCVLIYFGRAIAYYHDQKLHEQEQYSYLGQLFEVPLEDANKILGGRFPVSRLIRTRHDGSQERFLLNKVNPSRTHGVDEDYGTVLTDDVALEGFIESVKTNVVSYH